jgi:N-acetyl-gamma-glutamyl-phosphate reductase
MVKQMNRVGIIGATGYVAMELVRILAGHSGLKLSLLVSHSQAGSLFSDIYPAFSGVVDLVLETLDPDQIAEQCDFAITALPHGVSSEIVPALLDRGLRVIDHSGDFRYRDVSAYEQAYKLKHPRPDLLAEAVYGLPEIYRNSIRSARLVANPGCYPTCSILAVMPLLKAGVLNLDSIIIDAVSGISGAGRKGDTSWSYCETAEGFKAYGVVGHRHTSEIEQEYGLIAGNPTPLTISFTPHLAPMKRGMLATVYADLLPGVKTSSLSQYYETAYADEPFVRFLTDSTSPNTLNVTYSNFADVSLHIDSRTNRVKILCAIDNLGKGAAAQAVQSLNIMAGLPETSGLKNAGCLI